MIHKFIGIDGFGPWGIVDKALVYSINISLLCVCSVFFSWSIFTGFITSNNIPRTTILQITTPYYSKLTSLAVTILGFTLAFEINLTTQNLKFKYPQIFQIFQPLRIFSHYYTSLPAILKFINKPEISIIPPRFSLTRKNPTKTTSFIQIKFSTLVSDKKDLIEVYFLSFLIILTLSIIHLITTSNLWFFQ